MSAVVAIATLTPLPGKADEVLAALQDLVARVHAEEEGCLLYALHRHPDGERLVMVEKYTGPDAVETHGGTAHYQAASAALGGLLAAPPEVLVLEPVAVGDPAKGLV